MQGPIGIEGDEGEASMIPGPPGPAGPAGAPGGTANAGTAILDFTANSQRATVTVTGQAGLLATSHVRAWLMGDTTATHNAYEHQMVPIRLTCGSIVIGTSFEIVGVCEWQLSGTFSVHWSW